MYVYILPLLLLITLLTNMIFRTTTTGSAHLSGGTSTSVGSSGEDPFGFSSSRMKETALLATLLTLIVVVWMVTVLVIRRLMVDGQVVSRGGGAGAGVNGGAR